MLLNIYSPELSTRLEYILQFFVVDVCGITYKIYTDENQYLNSIGPKINYSNKSLASSEIQIYNHGFLFQKGIQIVQPETRGEAEAIEIFPGEAQDIPFDLFSACFYFLSRYEEYLPFEKDQHGRFDASQSFAFKHDLVEIPIVDVYVERFKSACLEKFPELNFQQEFFQFKPTIDIDQAYAIKEKGIFRCCAALLKALFRLDFKTFIYILKVRYFNAKDPFDVYEEFERIHRKYNLTAYYFILYSKKYTRYDINISRSSAKFRKLIANLSKSAHIGIHPSYHSRSNTKIIEEEIHYLSTVVNQPVNHSRQHFLKMRMPYTYKSLISIGIEHEYSMGFASQPGYRAGTARSFKFYDLKQEQISFLKIHPFQVMDASLKHYLHLSPEESLKLIQKFIDQSKKFKTTFCPLWHNESMSNYVEWQGWAGLYEEMIKYSQNSKG